MNNDNPGVLYHQDSSSINIRTQDLRKNNPPREERTNLIVNALANVKNMTTPWIKTIKQIELAKKWCPLVPEEYREDVCPIPPNEIVEKYRKEKNSKKGKP